MKKSHSVLKRLMPLGSSSDSNHSNPNLTIRIISGHPRRFLWPIIFRVRNNQMIMIRKMVNDLFMR